MEQMVRGSRESDPMQQLVKAGYVTEMRKLSLDLGGENKAYMSLGDGIQAQVKGGSAGNQQLSRLSKGQNGVLTVQQGDNRYSLLGSEIKSAKLDGSRLDIELSRPRYLIAWNDYRKVLTGAEAAVKAKLHDAVISGQLAVA